MSESEARAWLGLPADAKLNDLGRELIAALADVPVPVPGDDASALRTFRAFLEAADRRGIRPPPRAPARATAGRDD